MFDKIAVLVGCPCSADNSAPMNLGQDTSRHGWYGMIPETAETGKIDK